MLLIYNLIILYVVITTKNNYIAIKVLKGHVLYNSFNFENDFKIYYTIY